MKLFLNLTASLLTTFVLLLTSFYLIEVYEQSKLEPGDLGMGLGLFIISPFLAIISIVVCTIYFQFKAKHIPPIIVGSVLGLLLMKMSEMFWQAESVIHRKLMANNDHDTLFFLNDLFFDHANALPLILIVLCFFIFRKSCDRFPIKGFALGAVLGFFFSYFAVILIRKIDNTLTSFFYIQGYELYIIIFGTIFALIAGMIIEKKKSVQNLT